MRITEINMPVQDFNADGLPEIQMAKLGKIVVLAGKNGSGKTRLLTRVRQWCQTGGFGHANPTDLEANIKAYRQQLALESSDSRNVKSWQQQLRNAEIARARLEWMKCSKLPPNVVAFVPKSLALRDSNQFTKNDLIHFAREARSQSPETFGEIACASIQIVQNAKWEATHPQSFLPVDQRQQAIDDYARLDGLIKTFLGENLSRSEHGDALLFGRALAQPNLSEGQRILLQFCAAIYAQGASVGNFIVVMDEPENHLHPSAMLEAIKSIEASLTEGQLWVATHSIPLLAHFDPGVIWWMEKGNVSYAGSVPRTVLRGLLGDDEVISKTADFLNLPFELASTRFAYQCLFSPEVADSVSDDPQTTQIINVLKSFGTTEKVRLLDFGAGKGRLASFIRDSSQFAQLLEHLEYIAFDPQPEFRTDCENAIARLYGNATDRYFQSIEKLREHYDGGSFDVVLLCNVLHEIPADGWMRLFGLDGVVTKLLKETGFLLLVEDNQLPVGEKPHQKGFLVLDTVHVKTFFQVKESDKTFQVFPEREGRLKAHKIPKELVGRATSQTKQLAIRELADSAKQHIRELRGQESTYRNGRLHGFWVQQFANAQLALDDAR